MRFLLVVFLFGVGSLFAQAECAYQADPEHINTAKGYESCLRECVGADMPHAGIPMIISDLRLQMMRVGILKNPSSQQTSSSEAELTEDLKLKIDQVNQMAVQVGEKFTRAVWSSPLRNSKVARAFRRKIDRSEKERDIVAEHAGVINGQLVVIRDDFLKLAYEWSKKNDEYLKLLEPKVRAEGLWSMYVYYKWRKNLEDRSYPVYGKSVSSSSDEEVYSLVDDVVKRSMNFQSLLADSQKKSSPEVVAVRQQKVQLEQEIIAIREQWDVHYQKLKEAVQTLKEMDLEAEQMHAKYWASLGQKVTKALDKKRVVDSEWRAVMSLFRPPVKYYYGL